MLLIGFFFNFSIYVTSSHCSNVFKTRATSRGEVARCGEVPGWSGKVRVGPWVKWQGAGDWKLFVFSLRFRKNRGLERNCSIKSFTTRVAFPLRATKTWITITSCHVSRNKTWMPVTTTEYKSECYASLSNKFKTSLLSESITPQFMQPQHVVFKHTGCFTIVETKRLGTNPGF